MLFLLDPYPHHMIHMHVFRVQTCILSGSMGASDMHHNFFFANVQEEKQPGSGTVKDYDGVLTNLIQQSRYISINFSQDFLESVSPETFYLVHVVNRTSLVSHQRDM